MLGGSFDPVHEGHIALARLFSELLQPRELRIIPAGLPWQKGSLVATPEQRCAMLQLAFDYHHLPVVLDCREIRRQAPSYTIDTLRSVRAELGPEAPLVFAMGEDQLQRLDTWKDWRALFEEGHIVVGARPGFAATLAPAVHQEFMRRQATLAQLRTAPAGGTYFAPDLAVEIASSAVRAGLERGDVEKRHLAPVVLDYIQQQNLYKKS
nr:nicotinate-nucleotide adenylyltransferase [Massilia sp. TS11]